LLFSLADPRADRDQSRAREHEKGGSHHWEPLPAARLGSVRSIQPPAWLDEIPLPGAAPPWLGAAAC